MSKDELHLEVQKQFNKKPITKNGIDDLIEALRIVWKENEVDSKHQVSRITLKIKQLNYEIENQVEAAVDPSNSSIKDKLLEIIDKKQLEIANLENTVKSFESSSYQDQEDFMRFAFEFIGDTGGHFLNTNLVSRENRQRCKQVLFPAGFIVDNNKKVYTPEISMLYRLLPNEKDTEVSQKSRLVRVKRL